MRVTPCVGVWIETRPRMQVFGKKFFVTPCVGVWIETPSLVHKRTTHTSHPAWVCGLKLSLSKKMLGPMSHTLRGCVD